VHRNTFLKHTHLTLKHSQAPVAHTCHLSSSGGRSQEDQGSKPPQANSFLRPYLEKLFTKIGLVEWFKVKALSLSLNTTKTHNRYIFSLLTIYFPIKSRIK
jgi:hypothetical protein